jgi:hypothetical protein
MKSKIIIAVVISALVFFSFTKSSQKGKAVVVSSSQKHEPMAGFASESKF